MTPVAPALPRTARTMPAPQRNGSLAVSLLLHAAGVAGLLVVAGSAPKSNPPAAIIEMIATPRPPKPAPPAIPVPPPRKPPDIPDRPRTRPTPPPPLPQPETAPPASVRDETALAQADTLAAPSVDSTVTFVLPKAVPMTASQGKSGSTAGGVGIGLKGKLVSVTRLARMPVLTVASKPEYTAEMKQRNLAGKLRAKVLVDSDGKVKDALVLSDLGFGTREAGLAALRKLEFDPGLADGVPVAVWIPFTFTFEWQE